MNGRVARYCGNVTQCALVRVVATVAIATVVAAAMTVTVIVTVIVAVAVTAMQQRRDARHDVVSGEWPDCPLSVVCCPFGDSSAGCTDRAYLFLYFMRYPA